MEHYTPSNAKRLLAGVDENSAMLRAKKDALLSNKAQRRKFRNQRNASKYGIIRMHGNPLSGGLCK